MLDLAGENARAALVKDGAEAARDEEALAELVDLLDLDAATEVVDCFDVSNLMGTHVVASRVRFRRGHADRAGYRRFKIRDVDGQDDFASMQEAVRRSLTRGVKDHDLPDLVVIDGGPAQLARALEARQEAGAFDVPMVGLAKARAERTVKGRKKEAVEERLWLPEAEAPIELPRRGAARVRPYKISKRFDSDISAVCAGLALTLQGERIVEARLAFGGMAATVARASHAEAVLRGLPWDEGALRDAVMALQQDFTPLSDMRASAGYRMQVARNLLRRFWLETRQHDPLPEAAVSVRAREDTA